MKAFSLNIKGELRQFDRPVVMGIINITPDSFYPHSRITSQKELIEKVKKMVDEGVDILDIGACSTRPGSQPVDATDERERLMTALPIIRKRFPHAVLSVDTFRSEIARTAVNDFGVDIVNDISGGTADAMMFTTVAQLKVPYVLTYCGRMFAKADRDDRIITSKGNVTTQAIDFFRDSLRCLNILGVSDVMIDPGIGFNKTIEENFELLGNIGILNDCFNKPMLIGLSRKSLITRILGIDSNDALEGTVALNMASLINGAAILRVHDVKAARETVKLYQNLVASKSQQTKS